jgi:hypothetical protein
LLAPLVRHPFASLIFPSCQTKATFFDFIEKGGTADELIARIDAAATLQTATRSVSDLADNIVGTGIIVRCASEIEPEPITWLWPNRIAIGKQTLIAGNPGLGKSQLTAFLTAVVTTGGEWPCGEGRADQGNVVIFSAEDDAADTIVPRLLAAGADRSRVQIAEAVTTSDGKGNTSRRMFHLQDDLARLESLLSKIGDVRLVIIDPITAYLCGVDTHRNSDVRGVLGLVAEMAARHHVAIVVISHWNKSGIGSAVNRVTGSGAFTTAVRAAYMVAKDPDDALRCLFIPMKNNLARIDDDGPLPVKQVRSEADAAGHSWATIKRAKKNAGVIAFREGGVAEKGQWLWRLPTREETLRGSTNRYLAQRTNVSALGEVEHLSCSNGVGDHP